MWKLLSVLYLLWSHAPQHVQGRMAFSKASQGGCDQSSTLAAGVSDEQSSLSRLCVIMYYGHAVCYDFSSGSSFGINTQGNTVISIACTGTHVCVVDYLGSVYCQGSNSFGELGTGDTASRSAATLVNLGGKKAVAVSAGGVHDWDSFLTCVLLEDGNVSCFGTGFGSSPTLVYTGGDAVGIEVSNYGVYDGTPPSYCILKIDGSVKCDWMNSDYDFEGFVLGRTVTSVSSHYYNKPMGCATFDDNTMACWGAEDPYSLAIFPPSANIQAQPSDLLSLPDEAEGAVYVDFVQKANCFLGGSGNVYCRSSLTSDNQSRELHTVVDLGGRKALGFVIGSDTWESLGYALLEDGSIVDFSPDGTSYSDTVAAGTAGFAALGWMGYRCPAASQFTSWSSSSSSYLTPSDSLEDALGNVYTASTITHVTLGAGTFTLSAGYTVVTASDFTLQGSAVPGETIIECEDATACLSIEGAAALTVSGITFTSSRRRHDRRAQASSTGHGLQLVDVQFATLSDVIFDGLSGESGAALKVKCTAASSVPCDTLSVTRASFIGNSASEYGGAVYFELEISTVSIQFKDTIFSGNSAGMAGGAVFFKRSAVSGTDCTFFTNSLSSLNNNVFTDNIANIYGSDQASDICGIEIPNTIYGWLDAQSGALVLDTTNSEPKVVMLDAFGQTVATDNTSIVYYPVGGPTVYPSSGLGSAWTSDALEINVVNGVAVMSGLHVRAPDGYELHFHMGVSFAWDSTPYLTVMIESCPAGTSRLLTGVDDGTLYTCVNCAPGFFSNTTEALDCTVCDAGTYCPGGSTTPLPCPDLYLSNAGSGACVCDGVNTAVTSVRGCTDPIGDNSTFDCPTEGGTLLTMEGSNFGTGSTFITVADAECVITRYSMDLPALSQDATICVPPQGSVDCVLPAGAGLYQTVSLSDIGGRASAKLVSYRVPVVQTVSGCIDNGAGGTANCPRSGGGQNDIYITVTGTSFGPAVATVLVGGVIAEAAPASVTSGIDVQTTTIAILPASSGTSQAISVIQQGGEVSMGAPLLSYSTCGPGMFNVRADNANGFACASCENGFYSTADESFTCSLCPANFYCNTTVATSCSTVASGATSPAQSHVPANCTCPPTTMLRAGEEGTNSCVDCVVGLDCSSEGITFESVTVLPGYWRTSASSLDVRACPVNDACAGSQGGGDDLCADTRRGAYCSICKAGYTMSYSGQCKACEGGTTAAPLAVLSVFAVLAAAFALVRKTNGGTEAEDVSGEVGDSGNSPGKELASSVAGRPADIASTGPGVSIISTIFKVVVTFLQILTAMEGVFLVQFPAGFKNMLTSLSFVNLSILKMVSIDCVKTSVNFHSEVLFKTLSPLIVGAIVICFTAIRRQSGPERWQRCQTTLLVLTYLVLPGVATAVFRTFPCESFDDGTSWLRADYSIDCDGAEHKTMIAYASFMVLCYPIGVPCLYGWLLYRNRKALYPDGIDGLPMNEQLRMRAQTANKLEGMNFLYRSYSPQCWWYEIFETARRLMLTGFLIFILPGSPAQLGVALVIMMVSNLVARTYSPFITTETNRLNFIAQFQTSMALLAGLLLQAQPAKSSDLSATDRSTQGALNVLLIMLVMSVLCMAAYTSFVATKGTLDKLKSSAGSLKMYDLVSKFSPGNSPGRMTPPLANSPGGGREVSTPNSVHTQEVSPTGSFVSSLITPPRPREVSRPVRRINSRETNPAEL